MQCKYNEFKAIILSYDSRVAARKPVQFSHAARMRELMKAIDLYLNLM